MIRPSLCTFGGLKDGDLYIERAADLDLLSALRRGDYAYVLSSRQTGKTSLMLRTIRTLRVSGVRCAKLDLGSLGSESSPEVWYESLAMELAESLALDEAWAEACFARWSRATPVQRFCRFLREVVSLSAQALVLFVDEIEGFLKLPMRMADDFLSAIRALYNDRDREPLYRRLSFCLMGVCTAAELIRDERRTPFNVARSISLDDFRWEDVHAGFWPIVSELPDAEVVLARVFHWTQGHPYLTHRLVRDWVQQTEAGRPVDAEAIDQIVREQFLGGLGREQENFLEVERRLCLGPAHRARQRVALYKSVRQGANVPARGRDPIQLELRLTGLVSEQRNRAGDTALVVRNRILAELFDESWVPKTDPAKLDPSIWMKEQTERWHDFGRKDAFVLRGEELYEAQLWAAEQPSLDSASREFLVASERVDSHERSIRLYSLLWTLLWSSFTNFLLVTLIPEYWKYRAYAHSELIKLLYGLPFVLALPSGLLADRFRVNSATLLLGGLGAIFAGVLMLLFDGILLLRGLAFPAVLIVVLGQALQRPPVAVVFGLLYPRSDRRLDLTFLAYYFFVNLGALLGPLVGAAVLRQYSWPGLLATAVVSSGFALYSFAASRNVFYAPNLPLRTEQPEPPVVRAGRRHAVLLLTATMLIFWTAFYALGDTLHEHTIRSAASIPDSGLRTGNLLAQGLASEAITPVFVLALCPLLAGLMYTARRLRLEPTAPTKISIGLLVLAMLLLIAGLRSGTASTLGLYLALTLAELLVVPASMSMTTALSPSGILSGMMGGYFLVMGVGAWNTDLFVGHGTGKLGLLALLTTAAAVTFALRARSWTALFPRARNSAVHETAKATGSGVMPAERQAAAAPPSARST